MRTEIIRSAGGWTLRVAHPDGLSALKARGQPGHCLVCGWRLPGRMPGRPGRPRQVCHQYECKAARKAAWRADREAQNA